MKALQDMKIGLFPKHKIYVFPTMQMKEFYTNVCFPKWNKVQSPMVNDLIYHEYVMKLPLKIQKDVVWRISRWVNPGRSRESGAFGESMDILPTCPTPRPMLLFHLVVPDLYPCIINW